MESITVRVSRPYDIFIEDGILLWTPSFLPKLCRTNRVAVITDTTVDRLYGKPFCGALSENGYAVEKFVIEGGEDSKSLKTLTNLLEFLAEKNLRRNDCLLALGGGIVGDLTGFAASVYLRGIDYLQIPTTLLAAVDASVGGKTAVNLTVGKNLAGTFWQPKAVFCDSHVIADLPDRIFAEGMSEVIKHGVIGGEDILISIEENREKESLLRLISRNIEIKAGIVERDERESGLRKWLNFGHTVAHAIEKASGYTVSHGKAVGDGMVCETRLAERLGICPVGLSQRIFALCGKYGLFSGKPITQSHLSLMTHDKKNRDGKIVFTLPERIGKMKLVSLDPKDLLLLLNE